ncbi:hypothetical protein ACO2Q9_02775 [Variovorax sp. VNK109]|uniref:hypothetical protein n=1 Tax=Variovorax sp. VNK109 TaxID=3400919 RepID=UPI003C127E83
MKLVFAFALAAVSFAATATTEQDARGALQKACPGLATYASDLTVSSAAKQPASLTDQREKGWRDVYSFKVRVNPAASGRLLTEYRAQGQTCTFDVEASKVATVAVAKSACLSVCRDKQFTAGMSGYLGTDGTEFVSK